MLIASYTNTCLARRQTENINRATLNDIKSRIYYVVPYETFQYIQTVKEKVKQKAQL